MNVIKSGVVVRKIDGIDHIFLNLRIGTDEHQNWASLSTGVDGCGIKKFDKVDLFLTEGGKILGIGSYNCIYCPFSSKEQDTCRVYYSPEG
ncbi:MAG: hypothetical protein ACD_12C00439G0005 [uncultured bacterium]|nr:MAG: hypothetical protein ACD_12C00439G0005 [uncultured bacterium]